MTDLFERLFFVYGKVKGVSILFVLFDPVVEWVEGVSEEVGEGAVGFGLISHLTNIILYYLSYNHI